jgi:hypothetical protein
MTASSNIRTSVFQFAGRVALPPYWPQTSFKRLPNSGGQYTNTGKAAQEKRFKFQHPGGAGFTRFFSGGCRA